MSIKGIIAAVNLVILFLPVLAYADMGAHPESKFSVVIDENPFNYNGKNLHNSGYRAQRA